MTRKVNNISPIRKQLRMGKVIQTMEYKDGRLVMRKAQPKGLVVTNPIQKANTEAFAWACKASVYAIPYDRIAAEIGSQGTMYLPRDILVAAMYGTLVTAVLKDGTIIEGARTLPSNIQALLDTITKTPGALLVRGLDDWVGLPPGAATQVLTANGPGLIPNWQDASGGGSNKQQFSDFVRLPTDRAPSVSNYATRGFSFRPTTQITVDGLIAQIKSTNALPLVPYLAKLNGISTTPVVTEVWSGPQITTTPSSSGAVYQLPLTAPVTLAVGTTYAFMISRNSGSGAAALDMPTLATAGDAINIPILYDYIAFLAKTSVAVGDNIDTQGGVKNAIGCGAWGTVG